jgi:ribonuclease P protein component
MKNSLKNKKDIDKLFTKGKSTMVGNIIVKTIEGTPGYLFAVSSKKFKRAVDRNRIKRLMRDEVKGLVPTKSIALIYAGDKIPNEIKFRNYLSDSNV